MAKGRKKSRGADHRGPARRAVRSKAPTAPESSGMSEAQIREQGWAVDVPFEAPDPGGADLVYSTDGKAETWEAPEGYHMGGVPFDEMEIDPRVAKRLGLAGDESGDATRD